ncbi:hypothetical protein Drorol1_Dr00004332 [Drosera rotundifolia]
MASKDEHNLHFPNKIVACSEFERDLLGDRLHRRKGGDRFIEGSSLSNGGFSGRGHFGDEGEEEEREKKKPVKAVIPSYYRGAMGIWLVYDVTDESSFNNIRNWIRNIEQHASDNVNKILVGNKADMDESKRAIPTSKGQALADEYGIKFFETSAKTNLNVEEVFFSIARDIMQRLLDTDNAMPQQPVIQINPANAGTGADQAAQRSACCGS